MTTARAQCPSAADGQSHSLQSLQIDAQNNTLYFRHAGYVGWATPDENTLDDGDSTFTMVAPVASVTGSAASFYNIPEFPDYLVRVDPTLRVRLDPYNATDPLFNLSATFFLRSVAGGCMLESAAFPGHFVSFWNQTLSNSGNSKLVGDTPCHYPVCPAVSAMLPPAQPDATWNATSTWVVVSPNGGPAAVATTPFTVNGMYLEVRNDSGTLAVLHAADDTSGFSFIPSEAGRNDAGYQRAGDVHLRVRPHGSNAAWVDATTAVTGKHGPVAPQVAPTLPGGFWASDLTPLLPANFSVKVVRELGAAADGNGVVVSVTVTNSQAAAVEVGALGVAAVFNNDWSGLTLEQNAAQCSLTEPYVGLDGGYVKVTRITGAGPVLLLTPAYTGCNVTGVAACGAPFEAWRLLDTDPTPRSGTFEGFYEVMMHSTAYAQNEWAQAQPWNTPTSLVLLPGQSAVYSIRLSFAPSTEGVDAAVAAAGSSVARGLPGYVITPDMRTAALLALPPTGWQLTSVDVEPAGALSVGAATGTTPSGYAVLSVAVPADAPSFGRVRVSLVFGPAEGTGGSGSGSGSGSGPGARARVQTVQYYTLPSLPQHVKLYSNFTSTNVWFTQPDLFGRTYSFMDYDASAGSVIIQESRVFVAGLSDEAGAGSSLGFAVHQWHAPNPVGVAQLATYVNRTLVNGKPDGNGQLVSLQDESCNTRASMFWGPGMPGFDYTVNPCWDEPRSETLWRSYNYPHPATVLYSLYRLARDWEGLTPATAAVAAASGGQLDGLQPWQFYLNRSAYTMLAMWQQSGPSGLAQFGLMVGSMYAHLLDALEEEATLDAATWGPLATACDAIQRNRTAIWTSVPFPYGSEFPWDSTGQEEIFSFTQRYNADPIIGGAPAYRTSNLTLSAVKAYAPAEPHWAYHGSARRYWDVQVNGKLIPGPTERVLQHYGSGINSQVLLSGYRLLPNETTALAAGFAASMGHLTRIDTTTGAPSMCFHSDPSLLTDEPYTADYGVGLAVATVNLGCIVHNDSEVGMTGYGCDVTSSGSSGSGVVQGMPVDPYHRQIFFGPLGLRLRLRTAAFGAFTLDTSNPAAPLLNISFDHAFAAAWGGEAGGAAGVAGPSGGCDLYGAVRLHVDVTTHPSYTHVGAISFVSPSPAPPLVRSVYELPCDAAYAVITWVPV